MTQKYFEHFCGGRFKAIDRYPSCTDKGIVERVKFRCMGCGHVSVSDEMEQEKDWEDA